MGIRKVSTTITIAGANGSAAGNANTAMPINGFVKAVYVDPGTQPNTLDVIVKANDPNQTFLTITNASAVGWYYPRVLVQDVAGANLTAVYDSVPVDGYINFAGAQGNAGTFTVTLVIDEDD